MEFALFLLFLTVFGVIWIVIMTEAPHRPASREDMRLRPEQRETMLADGWTEAEIEELEWRR